MVGIDILIFSMLNKIIDKIVKIRHQGGEIVQSTHECCRHQIIHIIDKTINLYLDIKQTESVGE